MTNKETAQAILKLVGGEENITHVTHCATRLRLQVKNEGNVQLQELDQLQGVLKAQIKGGQVQVVIGAKVNQVYDEFTSMIHFMDTEAGEKNTDKNLFNRFFEMITSIITPIMAPLIGSGMMKCVVLLITTFGWMDASSGFIVIMNMIGDALFYFFPFFLAVSAAKKFNTNIYMGIVLAACLMHPTILDAAKAVAQTGVSEISFLGLPIPLVKYSSTLIPIIFSVWVLSKVYPLVERCIPDMVKIIFVPLITMMIMVPLELIVIGPLGYYGGNFVGVMIQNLYEAGGILSGFLLGFFRPILVMFGMHYAIQPIMIQQLADFGYTTLAPSAFAANLAQAGAVFGVFFLTKDKMMKEAAASSTVSAVLGITEPAIYGCNLKYKRPFFAGCLAAGVVSAFFSFINAYTVSFVLPSTLSISALNSDMGELIVIAGVALSFVLGFLFTILAGLSSKKKTNKESNENETSKEMITTKQLVIASPVSGEVVSLSDVNDKVFSQGLIGKGTAIQPSDGHVYAPFDAEVKAMFKSKHAIGLCNAEGVELLIHIGIDTVNLEGKYFTAHVEQGQQVKAGELLVSFDMDAIKAEGFDMITPVIVTNAEENDCVLSVASGMIQHGEPLLDIEREGK